MKPIIPSLYIFSIMLFLCGTRVFAEDQSSIPVKCDSIKIANKEYLKCTISRADESSVKIIHETGVSRFRIENLPDDIRCRFVPNKKTAGELSIKVLPLKGMSQDDSQFLWAMFEISSLLSKGVKSTPITVIQTIDVGILLASINDSPNFVMIIGDKEKRADGDKFNAFIDDTGRLQEYVSVLGAKKTVRVYSKKTLPTTESNIELLKTGKAFIVEEETNLEGECNTCADKWKGCKECKGTGRGFKWQYQKVKICWESASSTSQGKP